MSISSRLRSRSGGLLLAACLSVMLVACSSSAPRPETPSLPLCQQPKACPVCPACPAPTRPEPVRPVQPAAPALQAAEWGELEGWNQDRIADVWPALLASCSRLRGKPQWAETCAQAALLAGSQDSEQLRAFLETRFSPWRVVNEDGSQEGLVTGYYEPLIHGSLMVSARYQWPVYGVPVDMFSVELSALYPELKGMRLRGRLEGNRLVPYWTRAELARLGGAVAAPVLLWAEDPIELFFLQVQGSGRVQLPDGHMVRIGYADQNGHPYRSIGRWLVDQGEMPLSQASMQGIKAWARAHPERLQELLNVNPSFVFFRELDGGDEGPIGALGVPITGGRSIAVDARVIPLGAPVFLATTQPLSEQPLRRLMMAQDTGGAIKGAVRADFFWGFGVEAGQQAGRMRQQGRMWLLYPRGHRPDEEL